ncbi:uncharacterized protein BX664DRAFT_386462 [Halteromyces radiatus]|uniref:uncharacterized protein n=1 Tax=Halteromyces radiatus TaxID=101107 RepID=UPI0022202988|nr:uncharacterized protein BX664DRAFT_386462 [Halteromyces radiatus]KAI8085990.1 hypothetical protein BX664DRAFT_386462 [Halteromyces radiatus]
MTDTVRVLSSKDINQLLRQGDLDSANQVIDLMAVTFETYTKAHQSGNTHYAQAPQRIGVHTDNHYALFMPSRLQQTTAIKVVSVPTNDGKGGLPATIMVLDETNGSVQAIMNAAALTAVRTAAGSGVATRYFANPQANRLVIFGAGAQARAHIDMMIAARPSIEHITIWNRGQERREALVKLMQQAYPTRTFVGIKSDDDDLLEQAVHQAHIICTCTNATNPVLFGKWLSPGTHINCVGSYRMDMHEVDTETVKRATNIIVDSIAACSHEAGELVKSSSKEQWTEIGDIIQQQQQQKVQHDPHGISLFKSVGISVQDSAVAGLILDKAKQEDLGSSVPF